MKVLIIFGALFAVASAINPAAIYRSKCSEGASYWCQSATHADECGAVEYCIQNFWKGKLVQESATCSDCEAFINAVHNVLEQTSVQTEILDGAKQACAVMGSLSDLCQTLVETLGAEVLQKLVTELNGDEVCKVLQFCQENTSLQTNVNDDEICTLCKDAMSEANAFIANVTIQQDVENMLLQFCPLLSEIFPDCANFIQDEFPVVIQFLLEYLNPESCTEIGLCPGTQELQNLLDQIKKLKNREGVDLCSTCKTTISTVDSMLSNTAVQSAVILGLDQVCNQLGPMALPCKIAVKKYTPQIISMIITYLNPDTFCTEFRFCPSNGVNVNVGNDPCADCKTFFGDVDGLLTNQTVQNMIDVALDDLCGELGNFADQCKSYVDQYASLVFDFLASQLSPDQICSDIQFCTATPARNTKAVEKNLQPRGPSKVCTDCEKFFTDVQTKLNDPNVQNSIVNAIESVCSLFGPSADECRSYVEQYGDMVIQFIVSSIDPDTVCNDMGFCMSSTRPTIRIFKGPSKVCTDCEKFFTDVQTKLNDPNVQSSIVNAIESVCSLFGPSSDECRSYVEQYGDMVIQFIISSIDPDTVCNDIGFCMSSTRPSIKKFKGPSKVCTDCEKFFTDVQTKLNDPNVQNSIVNAIESVCSLSGPSADDCRSYVDQYGDMVIQFIISSIDPDTVCNDMGFCMSLARPSIKKFKGPSKVCTDCEKFFTDVQTKLSDPNVENAIVNAVESVCTLFGPSADDCRSYVEQYGDMVIQFIVSSIDADTVCNDMGFCMSSSRLSIPKLMKKKVNGPSKVCTDCEQFFTDVQTKLSDPNVENAIVNAIESVCSLFGPSADECRSYVEQYGDMVIQFIVSSVDPDTVCSDIGFCMSASLLRQKLALTGDSCANCKAFFGDVDSLLMNQTVENMITAEILQVCAGLGSFADQCKSYVTQYAPLVYSLIASQMNPDQICSLIQFCPAEMELKFKKLALPGDSCSDCQAFFGDVDSLLMNQTVENMITAEILQVCAGLGSFADQCKSYVTQYAPLVYSLIASQLNPDQICSLIQFCPAEKELKFKKLALPGDSCSDCQAFFGDVDSLLMNQTVENMITAEILQVCAGLGSFADQCKSYVTQYAPLVYSLVASQLNPDQICSLIQFCPAEMGLKIKEPRVDDAQVCTLCQSVISALETYVSSQANQAFVIQQLDTLICDNLPAFFSVQCRSVVKTYTPIVINLVLSYMDPKTICTEIKLCPGTSTLKVITDPQFCTDCKAFLGDIDSLLSNSTFQSEVLTQLEGLCAMAGSFEAECKLLIQTYGPTAFAFIVSELGDPTTDCTTMGLCPGVSAPRVTDPQFCSDCKNFLADIDALLSNQTLQNEVIAQLASLCSIAGSLQAECELLVKTYGPAAFAYLLAELDPNTACTEAGLCPGNSAPFKSPLPVISLPAVQPMATLHAAKPIPHKDAPKATDTDCDLCKTIVGLFLPYIESNATEEEVLNAVSEACDILTNPETVQECKNYVHTYGSLIFELLKNELSPESVCQTLGQCTSLTKEKASKIMKDLKGILSKVPRDNTLCTLCEIGIGELDTILSSNKTKGEITQEIEKLLCGNLPSPINTQCLSFMQIYGEVIVQLLIDQLEPSTFCADVGLCDAKKQVLKREISPLKASTECTICEFMVSELDNLITENSTETEIREALDKVCSLLPSTVQSECDSLVDTYTEDIVKYLVMKYNPKALCTAIGICSAAEIDASEQCILCEYIMSEVDKLLSENSTETEIQDVLDEVCSYLPATLRSECTEFVNEYTPFLISYLTQELDPKQFCTTIGECQAKLKVKKPTASAECAICEFVLAELDTLLKENATQEEIKKALDEVCDLLPSTVRTDCENFVNTYESQLIKFLVDESPDQICTLIALCSQNSKALLGSIECDLCQTAVREFMIAIQDPSVTKDIVALVNDTCAILPDDIKAQCYSYVDQYGDLVTQFIAQFFDPITSCTLLEACPYPDNAPRRPKQLLGQHECTRGPGYWCASMENAKKCNMVEHCQRHVWN